MSWTSHRWLGLGASALAGLATMVGCSGNIVTASDASTTTTQALLSVESTSPAGDAAGSAGAHASAYFLRLQSGADPSLAARMVGTSVVLPALGQCAPVEITGDEGMPLASLGPVDLIDVGQVALQGPSTRSVLAARAFPDVVDLVSGVVYTTRDPVADAVRDPSSYVFHISGSQSLPAMSIETHAPGTAAGLSVGGYALGADALSLPRADLTIAWQPNARADAIYVELASLEDGPLERVRCAFAPSGPAIIPASALPRAGAQSLSVHAVRRESISATGLDGGEVRFDLAVSGTIRFDIHP
ncbi:MAG TPA: hypothetical protein VGL13_09875 [Polyangiaceae bacterium]